MQIEITLSTHAGELDRQKIEVPDDDDVGYQTTALICEAIKAWTLAVGDVIAIREG
jgi:hypothetical protein